MHLEVSRADSAAIGAELRHRVTEAFATERDGN